VFPVKTFVVYEAPVANCMPPVEALNHKISPSLVVFAAVMVTNPDSQAVAFVVSSISVIEKPLIIFIAFPKQKVCLLSAVIDGELCEYKNLLKINKTKTTILFLNFRDFLFLIINLCVFCYFCNKAQFNTSIVNKIMDKNIITTVWTGKSHFETDNPSGFKLTMFDKSQDNGDTIGFAPKALMLSSLAGCSGLDVVSLLEKMRAEVTDFKVEVTAELTDEHPRFYNKVKVDYHFTDSNLQSEKIQKAVNLSVTKYCGVMEMFRQFAEVEIEIHLHTI
jgi:putative redox protein